MNSLEGKVALVTESARRSQSGLRQTEHRSQLIMQRRRKTRKHWPSASAGNGGKAKAIQADIGNPSQAKAFLDAAVKECGGRVSSKL